ncbi:hypothetical protein COCOBI_09-3320 [Coccomyxa sp. Obi]|nr:hypothetical protein COCOBI_09-3320 [Coccomyxa sp. Obi]
MGRTGCQFGTLVLLFALSARLATAGLVHHTSLSGNDKLLSQRGDWGDDRLITISSWGRVLQQEVTVDHEFAALSPAADSTSVPQPVAFFYLADGVLESTIGSYNGTGYNITFTQDDTAGYAALQCSQATSKPP